MTARTNTPYERVANAMHGVDDTHRDTIVYPDNTSVVGISECDDHLVLSYASSHDDGATTQMVWINTDSVEALIAIQEAISRVLSRVKSKEAK